MKHPSTSSARGSLSRRRFLERTALSGATLVGLGSLLEACGSSGASTSSGPTTITLAAPNQFTTSGTSFGPAWDTALKQFHEATGDTVNIDVLPLNSFFQTESTELATGTAPEIVFNQANLKPYMVTPLDSYLAQPNPFAKERATWLDWFNPNTFSKAANAGTDGNLYYIPFNLFTAALFVNLDAFAKAGVPFPLQTWEDWRQAVPKLQSAGYTVFGMDNSTLAPGWTFTSIGAQLFDHYFTNWNWFNSSGQPGTSTSLSLKDFVRAIKAGQLHASLPEMAETLKLLKEAYSVATPNWAGIQGLSGLGVNFADFISGKSAITWGADFGFGSIQSGGVTFKVGSMPWPTITPATTPLSMNVPARFEADPGSAYMIPSTTRGDKLATAIKFLQFMTTPKYNQPWLNATFGVPTVETVQAPSQLSGFTSGHWAERPRVNTGTMLNVLPAGGNLYQIIQGYLLNSTSLPDVLKQIDDTWQRGAVYQIQQNGWSSEDWAK